MALAYYRGVAASEIQGSEKVPAGAMMAVGADSNCVEPLLESLQSGFAVVACFNSPDSVTISGDRSAVEELASMLEEKGIFHRMLKVDVAYHSDHMLGAAKGYLNNIAPILERCPAATSKATMFSSVNGLAVIPMMARSPWYWVSNLINPVQFSTALGTMASAQELRSQDGSITLVEIGPHATLGSPIRQILSQSDIRTQIKAAHVFAAMKRGQDACTAILETVSSLISRGFPVDCAAVGSQTTDPLKSKLLVDLPPYSFNKTRRYWHESRLTKNFEHGTTPWNVLLGHNMPSTVGQDLQFRNVFKLDDVPWLTDHVINDIVVFPMAGYISAAIEAIVLASLNQTQEVDAFHLREVRVGKALALSAEGYHELFTILKPAAQGTRSTALSSSYDFQILSWTHDIGFSEHCKGSISLVMQEAPESVSQTSIHSARALWMNKMRGKIESAAARDVEAVAFYQKASQVGLQYGPSFRLMSALRIGEDCAVGTIRCDETRSQMPMQYETALKIHPTILDACFHVGLSNGGNIDLLSAQVPTFFPEIIISNKLRQNLGDELQVYCQHLEKDKMSRSGRLNIFCFDDDSEEIPVIEIRDGRVFDIGEIDTEETVAEATNPCKTEWIEWSSPLVTSAFEDSEPVSEADLEAPILNEEVTLITETLPPDGLIDQLAKFVGAGNSIQHLPMAAACHKSEAVFICLDEIWQPVLTQMDEKKFEALRNLAATASAILWVTRSDAQAPLSDFAFGFARSLRLENLGLKFVVLQLEANSLSTTNIAKVFEHAFVHKPGVSDSDVDYKEVDGQVQVPRLVPDNGLYRYLDQETNKSRTELQPFWQDGRPLEITMSTVGLFSSIHFQDSASVDMTRPLEDNEVLIEIRATGLNFKDVLIALGSIPWQSIGRECSGVVLAAGAGTDFKKGDSVIHCGEALFATHSRCKSQTVIKMPIGMTYEEAASIPIVYSTAYECLVEVARLQAGEKVLIHAASGGVGQAAIMLAQWIGAEIFATVGTKEKKEFIMSTYGIPEDHIFSSRSTTFARALLAATDSSGVDVVLNSLAGEMLKASWHCLAPFGRFVEIGKKDALANMQLDMSPFDIGVSYTAVDLSLLIEKRADYFHRLMSKVMALFNAAAVKPVHPIKCISIADLEVGLRTMQTGKHMGKIVVVNDEKASVQARCRPVRTTPIRPDGSYIITGGTGGLGRCLAQWLVEKGAKSIILSSRSGGVDAKLEELMKLGLAANAKVQIVKCDVGSLDDVKRLVEVATYDAPVRGLVHSAMVLKDAALENTSWVDWQAVLSPKVIGAINLHNALRCQPLDFFICLSSMTGIFGIPGQTSYGGSNTFLDAFCRWRGLQNLPAASISLPAVSDIGYVAENITHGDKDKTDNIYGCSITGAQVQLLVQAAAETGIFNPAMNNNHTTPGISMRPNSVLRSKLETPMLSHIRKLYSASSLDLAIGGDSGGRKGPSLKDLLARETDYKQAFQLVVDAVVHKIGSIMMLPIEDVTLDKPLADIGLDSLVAVEFRNWMVKELGAKIPLLDIINSGSLGHLIEKLMRLSTFVIANEKSDISMKEEGEEGN
jgi:NADPH:quinone reductase-like Zn-dependent oxidoreductase/acyl transferase domain-containing protein/acyl carrier protein